MTRDAWSPAGSRGQRGARGEAGQRLVEGLAPCSASYLFVFSQASLCLPDVSPSECNFVLCKESLSLSLGCHDLSSRCEGKGRGIGFPTRARLQGQKDPLPVLAFPTPPALKVAFPPEPVRPRVRVAGPPTRPGPGLSELTGPLAPPLALLQCLSSD